MKSNLDAKYKFCNSVLKKLLGNCLKFPLYLFFYAVKAKSTCDIQLIYTLRAINNIKFYSV